MSKPSTLESDAFEFQRDECESIIAIFSDDVKMHSHESPISYSIKLRPTHEEVEDESVWPLDKELALKVEYPKNYPEETPIFGLMYGQSILRLHPIQENALLNHINSVAESELGIPCVLSCFYAARDFFNNLGLVQAALSMLSDDCLASVLSYLTSSKEDVDCVVAALPLFSAVYKTDIVWKELCCSRWKNKWGFERRWNSALVDFQQRIQQSHTSETHRFWFDRYAFEEHDSRRRVITREELCQHPFEQRQWFAHDDPHGNNLTLDIQPTGLTNPGRHCQFTFSGYFLGYSDHTVTYSIDGANPNIIMLSSEGAVEHIVVRRTPKWGWQLNNDDFVLRSMDERFESPDLWTDLTSNLVMQERPPGVVSRFNWREIPDDDALQFSLPWRNSWRAPLIQG